MLLNGIGSAMLPVNTELKNEMLPLELEGISRQIQKIEGIKSNLDKATICRSSRIVIYQSLKFKDKKAL